MTRKNLVASGSWTGLFIIFVLLFSVTAYAAIPELKQAQALISEGKLEQALTVTDNYLAKDNKSIEGRFIRGLILTKMNKLEQASEVFLQLTQEHPELPEPYNNLAVVYAALGQYEKARSALQQAINTHPSYATAHENIGDIYAKMASQAYNQALELDQSNITAREKLSLISDLFSSPASETKVVVAAETTKLSQEKKETAEVKKEAKKEVKKEIKQEETIATTEPVQKTTGTAINVEKTVPEKTQPEITQLVKADEKPKQEDSKAVIIKMVEGWKSAWSNQDVDSYLSFYADEFTPPENASLPSWKEDRRDRLSSPKFIKVSISKPTVIMHGKEHAQVMFTQTYQSDTYKDQVKKTLLLKKLNEQWLIVEETSK